MTEDLAGPLADREKLAREMREAMASEYGELPSERATNIAIAYADRRVAELERLASNLIGVLDCVSNRPGAPHYMETEMLRRALSPAREGGGHE